VFFFSTRPGGVGGVDLWTATRETVFDQWSTPTNLGSPVNTLAADTAPYIAADRETLYFASNRQGGLGQQDLYVTTRKKQHPESISRSIPMTVSSANIDGFRSLFWLGSARSKSLSWLVGLP